MTILKKNKYANTISMRYLIHDHEIFLSFCSFPLEFSITHSSKEPGNHIHYLKFIQSLYHQNSPEL